MSCNIFGPKELRFKPTISVDLTPSLCMGRLYYLVYIDDVRYSPTFSLEHKNRSVREVTGIVAELTDIQPHSV